MLGARSALAKKDSFKPRLEKLSQWTEIAVTGGETPVAFDIDYAGELVMTAGQSVDAVNYRSIRGIDATWSETAVTVTGQIIDIHYAAADDTWLIAGGSLGASAFIQTSTNGGANWTARTVPTSTDWIAQIWSNPAGEYVAVGRGGELWTSTDAGVTWTERTIPGTPGALNGVRCFANGVWCAVGANDGTDAYCITASDPTGTWTERSNGLTQLGGLTIINDVLYTNISWGASGLFWVESRDGITWTQITDADVPLPGDVITAAIPYGRHRGGMLYHGGTPNPIQEGQPVGHLPGGFRQGAVGSQDNCGFATTEQFGLDSIGIFGVQNLSYAVGSLVSAAGLKLRKHTPAAAPGFTPSWTDVGIFAMDPAKTNANDDRTIYDVVWADEIRSFIAVGYWFPNGGSSRAYIIVSQDGKLWHEATGYTANTGHTIRAIAWDGTTLVAVGDDGTNGQVRTSTDGENWTTRSPSSFEKMYGIATDGTTWVTAGLNGKFAYSTNPVGGGGTWTEGDLPSATWCYQVLYDGTRFITGGDYVSEPKVYYSTTGTGSWTSVTGLTEMTDDWQHVAVGPNGQGQTVTFFAGNGGQGMSTRDVTNAADYVTRDIDAGTALINVVVYDGKRFMCASGAGNELWYEEDPEQDTWNSIDMTVPITPTTFTIQAMAYSPRLGRWTLLYADVSGASLSYGCAWSDNF